MDWCCNEILIHLIGQHDSDKLVGSCYVKLLSNLYLENVKVFINGDYCNKYHLISQYYFVNLHF